MLEDRSQAQSRVTSDEDVLDEAKERLKDAVNAWRENHEAGQEDVDMRNGDQWPEEIRADREEQSRPCLTFNRLDSFIDQVVGDQRQSRPQVQVHPVGFDNEMPDEQQPGSGRIPNMAGTRDYTKAEVLNGIIRNIEYHSDADIVYDTGFDGCVGNGFGYWRIVTDYVEDNTFEQDIRLKRIRNPFTVYMDPAMESVTGEDAMWAFISVWMAKEEFEERYPDATPAEELERSQGEHKELWWEDDQVRVLEYFRKVPEEHMIVEIARTGAVYDLGADKDEQQAYLETLYRQGLQIADTRMAQTHRVEWYVLNGQEVLDGPITFPSKYIPIVPVFGKEIIKQGKPIYRSLIRNAHDAQKNYNFWRTAMTEWVALQPKQPYIGPAKAFSGYEHLWETANTTNYSYIPYNDNAEQPPQRQGPASVSQGAAQEAQFAEADMKGVIGMHAPSLGEREGNESGRAIMALQNEGDTATYAFSDNLRRAIQYTGRILIDMIPRIYENDRIVRIQRPDGQGDYVKINVTTDEGRLYDLGTARFDIVAKAGPSHTTQRREAASMMMEMAKANPQLWSAIGDLIVSNMDWPEADEVAKRLRKMAPEGIIEQEPGEEPRQPTMQEQLQQAQIKAEMADAEAKAAKAEADKEKAEADKAKAAADETGAVADIAEAKTQMAEIAKKLEGLNIEQIVEQASEEAARRALSETGADQEEDETESAGQPPSPTTPTGGPQ